MNSKFTLLGLLLILLTSISHSAFGQTELDGFVETHYDEAGVVTGFFYFSESLHGLNTADYKVSACDPDGMDGVFGEAVTKLLHVADKRKAQVKIFLREGRPSCITRVIIDRESNTIE